VPVRPLGPAGQVEREPVSREVDRRDLADHPLVEQLAGELPGKELAHLAGVRDLRAVVCQLLVGDPLADLGGKDLLVEVHDLAGREVALQHPVGLPQDQLVHLGREVGLMAQAGGLREVELRYGAQRPPDE
jgi:hypothetical protein